MNVETYYEQYESLFLPLDLVAELQAKYEDGLAARIKELEATRRQQAEERAVKKQAKEDAESAEDQKSEPQWENPLADHRGPLLKIFDSDDVTHYASTLETSTDAEQRRRAKALIAMLQKNGELRKLATIPEQWRQDLDQLSADFPNFGEVIDYIKVSCALAERSDRVLRICMLFAGPAGTGKSLFSQTLAKWVGGGYACVRYESAQSNSEMAGSSSFWSNTKPGKPFTLLTEQDYANPTFFLDEIDKVSASQYDPLGALYALLEPGTAREHTDLSWPFLRLDCSRINYIAACNNPDAIPAPLRSRLRTFDIPVPTPEQAQAIAENIIAEEAQARAPWMEFSEDAIDALCQLSPRRMRQMVQEALGRALYHGRDTVQAGDVACTPAPKRGIGFLA